MRPREKAVLIKISDGFISLSITPGLPVHWRLIAPTSRRMHEPFYLGIRADDEWGNPSDRVQQNLSLESNLPIENLPEQISFPLGQRSVKINNLYACTEGVYRISLYDSRHGHLADANPVIIQANPLNSYWGDLHGQTGETVGINTAREYMIFARDLAFLDVTSHQGNDFQIKAKFWEQLNRLTAEFYEKGKFVTFPGYEWSGNTDVGGDHNVYFSHEGCTIRRSSHALVKDDSDMESDAPTVKHLFTALNQEDCMVYAHVGGRYADIAYAHDPKIETVLEIHSAWSTFEWLLMDSFALNYRCGIVCNSDDHKCRPGASHPGASYFGAYGGLTCFLASELTRESIFECLRKRHHFGTSEKRLHLDVRVRFKTAAKFFEFDPRVYNVAPQPKTEIITGDIAQTEEPNVKLYIHAATQAPIERIEVFNAGKLLWLDDINNGRVILDTNDVTATLDCRNIGMEDIVFQRGALEKKIRIFRMPTKNPVYELQDCIDVSLNPKGDNPLWVRVTTEDGNNAWSSPYSYHFRGII
jgi:hypothetical protein